LNILTVDWEDWYHPEYVRQRATAYREDHSSQALKKTLQILDKHDCTATFFVLGELAQKHPESIQQIEERGHEIAFHGYDHVPLTEKTPAKLEEEIIQFSKLTGRNCKGFRAPSFSLSNQTKWALDTLEKNQFEYDSSIFPVNTPLYGLRDAPIKPYKPSHFDITEEDPDSRLWEFPLHIYESPIFRLPTAGGFYLRFLPLRLINRSIQEAIRNERPAVVFVHTWELDLETPKLKLGPYKSFITYHNLGKTSSKLEQILSRFDFTSIQNYMKEKDLH
jgi:polysaccharide deacetylase family protein (PEP-CTERM system associated)